MSTFAEHLEATKGPDGEYRLDVAEAEHAKALAEDDSMAAKLAARAAKADRSAWEAANRNELKKQFAQPALSADLELDVLVPLGNSTAVPLRDMNEIRIRQRMDLRTRKHVDENDAYGREMEFWFQVLGNLPPGGTLGGES